MVKVHSEGFRKALTSLGAAIQNNMTQAVGAAVQAGTESAKQTTLYKDRTGDLRKETHGERFGLSGEIRADSEHAVFVNNGTRPHDILPVSGSVLSFMQNGRRRFARSVHHPGTDPRPFMDEARHVAEQTLEYGAEYFVDYAIQRFNR